MLELQGVRHCYREQQVAALERLHLDAGEQALLLGPSGSGKTTLLHIIGGLLQATQGQVRVNGCELATLKGTALDRFRGRHIGIVFQRLHLIASLTVLQNLLVAQYSAGLPTDAAAAVSVLERLGIADKARAKPSQLSQGQAQRVAIARAAVNRPSLILADEPTSSLDDASAANVLNLLREQAQACNAMLLIATHDARAISQIPRQIRLGAPS